nr:hypothetical protein [Pontimonas salivibrio]
MRDKYCAERDLYFRQSLQEQVPQFRVMLVQIEHLGKVHTWLKVIAALGRIYLKITGVTRQPKIPNAQECPRQ